MKFIVRSPHEPTFVLELDEIHQFRGDIHVQMVCLTNSAYVECDNYPP